MKKRSPPNRPAPARCYVNPPLVRMDELTGEELRDPKKLLSCIASMEYTHRKEMKTVGERLSTLQKKYDTSQCQRIKADRELLDCMVNLDARGLEIECLKKKNCELALVAWEEREKVKKWQGTSLRLNWLIEEMEKVGAIRLPEHEWATEMRQSIEYPDDDYGLDRGNSIYQDVYEEVLRENLPNYQDAHMEIVSEEEENRRYAEWTREAQTMPLSNPEIEASVKRCAACWIQKMWRGWVARKAYRLAKEMVASAIYIQKIWRGYSERQIKMYPGDILDADDPIILGSMNLNLWKYKGGKKFATRRDLEEAAVTCFIGFCNTGSDEYTYEYCDVDCEWDMGNTFAGIPATPKWPRIGVGPYAHCVSNDFYRCKTGDWFVIRNISRGWKKMLRISKCDNFFKRCVDLNTGITFDPICGGPPRQSQWHCRINNIIKINLANVKRQIICLHMYLIISN